MEPFKSIIVDIDTSVAAHPALDRALRLARKCGAKLTITDVLTFPAYARGYLPANVEEEMTTSRRERLAELASAAGFPVQSRLLAGRPATALIQEVLGSDHDLLVRSHARDLAAPEPRSFGAIDMELIRKCPCPVLLVGPGGTRARPQVVGAVNASTDEEAEQALNRKLVEMTLLMSALEEGTPMLLQAWAPFAERTVRSHSHGDAFAVYVEDVRRRTEDDLVRLAQSATGSTAVQTAHVRGEPEDVIPAFVVSRDVDLVVMGTQARAGIAGMLIGNTAERVLRKLSCSVLAVKPDGFVSPVPRPAAS